MKYLLAILILVSLSVRAADAQCRQRIVSHYSYPVHEQIVEQQVYYFVGQPLRIESLLRLEKENTCYGTDSSGLVEEFRQYQEFKKLKRQSQRSTGNTTSDCDTCNKETPDLPVSPDTNTTNTGVRGSLFEQKCGKCHSGASPKGQLSLDGEFLLTSKQMQKVVMMVNSGKMPKGGPPLSDNEKNQVIAELSARLN